MRGHTATIGHLLRTRLAPYTTCTSTRAALKLTASVVATGDSLSVAWLLGSSELGGRVSWTWKTIYSFDAFTAPLEKLEVDSRNSKRYSLIRFIPTGFLVGMFWYMCAILACRYLVQSLCFSNIITAIANTIIDFSVATRYNYFIYETARFEWRRRHEGKL